MKTLRLLVTKQCGKGCEGCCNKDWDLDSLPVVEHFNYDEILITGGEPYSMISSKKVTSLMDYLKYVDIYPKRKIYLYTAESWALIHWWKYFDGFTLTLHHDTDIKDFLRVGKEISALQESKSLRLNIFKGINLPKGLDLSKWVVKENIEWIKDCPLPENEVFMRLQNID